MLHTFVFDGMHVYSLFIASKHLFHIKSGNLPARGHLHEGPFTREGNYLVKKLVSRPRYGKVAKMEIK